MIRISTLSIIVVIILLSHIVYAQDEVPTPDKEYDVWKALKDKVTENEKQWPFPVTDTLKSFDQDISINFDCKNSKIGITKVKIKIRTKFIRWDNSEPNAAGVYRLGTIYYDAKEGTDTVRYISSNSGLMINPNKIKSEDSSLKQLENEGTFYHELLHGQLLINAMSTDDWKEKTCNGDFDEGPTSDEKPHDKIYDLANQYIDTLIKKNDYNIIEKQIGFLVAENKFTVRVNLENDLLDARKMGDQIDISPGTANIEIYSSGRPEGEIYRITEIKGEITGRSPSEGKIILRVDPVNTVIKYTIYISYADDHPIIRPGKTKGPELKDECGSFCHGETAEYKRVTGYNLDVLGFIILCISLLIIGVMKLKRKNK